MNQLVPSTKLTELIAISSRIIRGDAARMSLRTMFIKRIGLNPRETWQMRVFFRQYLAGVTFLDVFDELSRLSNSVDKIILHLTIQVSPMIDVKETHWYRIIRYCLFCLGQTNMASAVFLPPSPSGINLFILNSTPFADKEVLKNSQYLINQMMMIKIAIWLKKPAYLSLNFDGQPIDTPVNYMHFVARALHDALDIHRACSIEDLKHILKEHYGLNMRFQQSRKHLLSVEIGSSLFSWIRAGEPSLCLADIEVWMEFNRVVKNHPIADRIRRGVESREMVNA